MVDAVEASDPKRVDTLEAPRDAREGVGLESAARCRAVVLASGPPGDVVGSPEICDPGADE